MVTVLIVVEYKISIKFLIDFFSQLIYLLSIPAISFYL